MNSRSKIGFAVLAVLLVSSPAARQTAGESSTAAQENFSRERLEQLVAPIALHPDPLLTQILIASTYPLEIVQAERWVEEHRGLQGSALEEALKAKDWDPSVKAMCGFPTVLKQMDDDLDWTRDLGDAFLGQKGELMDAVQRMRRLALDAGNLKTTSQQRVVQTDGAIVIESASPDVVYVPAYSPVVVYGAGWYYPYWYYPYWYYPPPYGGGFVTFSVGYVWGSACWSHCNWSQHGVVVDALAFRSFTARTCSSPVPSPSVATIDGRFEWTHNPSHRQGVGYRSPRVASSFGAAPGAVRVPLDRARTLDRRGDFPRPAHPNRREPVRPRPPPRDRP